MASVRRIHPAWTVLVAITLCLLATSGLRATFAVYIKPIEADMGWSRGALSVAAALSLLLLGATGPFAGRLADRWGPRRVIVLSLLLLGGGSIASAVVARWFETHRGAAIGVAAGGMSAGQLVVIPLASAITLGHGWRWSFLWLGVALLALVLPVAAWLGRNTPEERGLQPYGASGPR